MKNIILSFALIITLATTQTACPKDGPGPVIADVTIECLGEARPQIDALLMEFTAMLTQGKIDWSNVYQRAKQAGKVVGGCALAELVQLYLGGTRSIEQGDGWNAHMALEEFRHNETGGASFKTMCTRTDGSKTECKL